MVDSPETLDRPRTEQLPGRDPEPDDRVSSPKPREHTNAKAEDAKAEDAKAEKGQPDTKQPARLWPKIVLAVFVVAGVSGGVIYWLSTRNLISTDDAFTDGRAITIAPQVNGEVVALNVNDNQRVHRGDVLIEIDPREFIAARDQAEGSLVIAQAQLANARLNLQTARIDYPAKLAASRAQLSAAQANLINARSQYNRQHGVARGATTQADIDQSTSGLQAAQAQVDEADASVRQADLIPQRVAQAEAQVKQWQGQVEQAQAALDRAALNLTWTKVLAPQDGWITRRNVEMGTYVQAGQSILSLVTPDLWVTANFKETQLDRVRPGQHVDISVDEHPELKLTGHVDSIQLGSGSKFTAFPTENATGNYVKIVQRIPVKIDIDSGLDPAMPPLPLGESVTPVIDVR